MHGVKVPVFLIIYDLKSFALISLCFIFVGIAVVASQSVSSNSVLAQGENESSSPLNFFNPLNSNNISGIDYGTISSLNQTNEPRDLDESNVSSTSENQTKSP
ncbi:MAG: hypothetical protein ACRD8W_24215 [Nitrososphaeraceae archaeon]